MTSPSSNAVLITGATGGIGRPLIKLLVDSGHPVRALCRRPDQVADFEAQGVAAVLGNLDDPGSLKAAMVGCDRVFLLTLAGPKQCEHGRQVIEAAAAADVKRVVHLSTADANVASSIPWASAPAHTDMLLKESGVDWTILRPSAFMQNIVESAAPIRRGFLPQTSGRGAVGWIDSADIATVAAHVLTESGHNGQEYTLTGPELLSVPDIAAVLSTATGHRVRYVHLPAPLFRVVLRLTGMDAWQARGLVHQFVDVVRHGHDGGRILTDTVYRITGVWPTSFRDFAAAHRAAFAR